LSRGKLPVGWEEIHEQGAFSTNGGSSSPNDGLHRPTALALSRFASADAPGRLGEKASGAKKRLLRLNRAFRLTPNETIRSTLKLNQP